MKNQMMIKITLPYREPEEGAGEQCSEVQAYRVRTTRTTRNTQHRGVMNTMSVSKELHFPFHHIFFVVDKNGFKVEEELLCDEICLAR